MNPNNLKQESIDTTSTQQMNTFTEYLNTTPEFVYLNRLFI
jgi:hypothetical protein